MQRTAAVPGLPADSVMLADIANGSSFASSGSSGAASAPASSGAGEVPLAGDGSEHHVGLTSAVKIDGGKDDPSVRP